MDQPHIQAIEALVQPILAEQDVELVELFCHPQGGRLLVRLLVDQIGGITLARCAQLNQRIADLLETSNLIEGSFTLEVSSPGLDRPLTRPRDFERALGEQLQIEVHLAEGHFKTIQGMLLAVQPLAIVLRTSSSSLTVAFREIQSAKKCLRW